MIVNLTLIVYFIVVTISMVRYKRLTMPFKILSLSILFEFLVTLTNPYIIVKYKNNVLLSQIETAVTYILYALIYYYLLKNKYLKKVILISIILMTAFSYI